MKTIIITGLSLFLAWQSYAANLLIVEGETRTSVSFARNLKADAVCPVGTHVIGGGCKLGEQNLLIHRDSWSAQEAAPEFKLVELGIDTVRNAYVCQARQIGDYRGASIPPTPGELTAQASCLRDE